MEFVYEHAQSFDTPEGSRADYFLSMVDEPSFAIGAGVTSPFLSTFTASRFVLLFSAPPVFL
jgi:hypothetical protein